METIEVLCPAADGPETLPAQADPAPFGSLAGRVVGIIDNAKPNFAVLADALESALREDWGVARVVRTRKHSPAVGAAPQVLGRLAQECDLVIAGIGD